MASAVKGPLGRFRKHDSSSPLHERWGDVRITVPTEGSWNQYENPRQSSLREGTCSTGFVPAAMSRSHDDETAPLTEYDHRIARPSSLSVKALNPRRLSVRLNPRSKTSNDSPQEKDQQPTTKAERRRSQFAYRPIQQDYPTEIAEKTAFPEPRSPRFKYIPAGAQFTEELRAISPELHSSRRASSYIPYDEGSLERRARPRTRFDQLEDASGDQVFEGGHHHFRQSRSLASPRRSEASSSRRASASVERGLKLSTFDKRATRLGKYMTTAMVPDPDQLYE